MKKSKIINTVLILSTVALSMVAINQHKKIENQNKAIVEITEKAKKVTVIDNEDVNIEYIKVSTKNFQGYDILVTAKNNTNISSEWELKDATHYNSAYLVGMNKKSAERFYEKILKDQGYKWTWEDNVKPWRKIRRN